MISITEKKPVLQVMICTRTKEKGESCGPKGAAALREALKKWTKEQNISPDVKITASLCLNHCEKGITVGFQPTNEWLGEVVPADIDQLKEKILKDYRDIKAQID